MSRDTGEGGRMMSRGFHVSRCEEVGRRVGKRAAQRKLEELSEHDASRLVHAVESREAGAQEVDEIIPEPEWTSRGYLARVQSQLDDAKADYGASLVRECRGAFSEACHDAFYEEVAFFAEGHDADPDESPDDDEG